MCELFGLTGPDEILLNEYLETFAGHSVNHPNGWGIAIFCGKEVNIEKEPVAAYRSSYLKERLRTPLRAANMMAHIRFATRGHMAYENCHPFVRHDASGRAWTFMHNGTIFSCPLLSKYLYTQSGQTDSERILLYMIDQINAEIEKQGRILKNFMLYDGSMLYVHDNLKGSLFVHHLERSLLFATTPLNSKKWEPVEPCRLQAYKNGRHVLSGTAHQNEYIENPEDMKLIFLDYAQL